MYHPRYLTTIAARKEQIESGLPRTPGTLQTYFDEISPWMLDPNHEIYRAFSEFAAEVRSKYSMPKKLDVFLHVINGLFGNGNGNGEQTFRRLTNIQVRFLFNRSQDVRFCAKCEDVYRELLLTALSYGPDALVAQSIIAELRTDNIRSGMRRSLNGFAPKCLDTKYPYPPFSATAHGVVRCGLSCSGNLACLLSPPLGP